MRLSGLAWRDNVSRAIAYALPHRVIAWAVIRVWAHATTGRYGNTDATAITAHEIIHRWDKSK